MEVQQKLDQFKPEKLKYKMVHRVVSEGINKDTVAILKHIVEKRDTNDLNWETLESVICMSKKFNTV